MNHVNILEARIKEGPNDIFYVEAQIRNHLVEPYTNILVTEVVDKTNLLENPFEKKVVSYMEFMQEIYNIRSLYEEQFNRVPNSKIIINMESFPEEID